MKTDFKSQLDSLIHYAPRQYSYWKEMYEWRRKYGAPRSIKCNGSYCWVLIWLDPRTGEDSVEHVSFHTARLLAPRLDCFIYTAKCGCTKRWWGSKVSILGNCDKHGLRRVYRREDDD